MKLGVEINQVDVVVLGVVAVLIVLGVKIVIGFFKDNGKK